MKLEIPNYVLCNKKKMKLLEIYPFTFSYWAFGKLNTTVYDDGGLPWFCYTYRQTHCRPLFKLPPKWRTTRHSALKFQKSAKNLVLIQRFFLFEKKIPINVHFSSLYEVKWCNICYFANFRALC